MSTNLISLGLKYLTPDVISRIASALGVDKTLIGKAATAALPALIGSLAGAVSKPDGASRLNNAIAQQRPGLLDNLSSIIGGSGQQDLVENGMKALGSLLGTSSVPSLAGAIGKFAGLNQSTSSSLLGMLAPAVLGLLGQEKQKQGLDASGLARLLTDQRDYVAEAMPSELSRLLESADVPGFSAASSKGSFTQPPASVPKKVSASPSLLYWLLPLVALAGLGWWLLADRTTTPERTPVTKQEGRLPSLTVGDVDLAQSWEEAFGEMKGALAGISDVPTAQAALPKLSSATTELGKLGTLSQQLPAEGRSALAKLVVAARPALDGLFDKVLAIPGVAEIARPAIEAIRTECDKLAKT